MQRYLGFLLLIGGAVAVMFALAGADLTSGTSGSAQVCDLVGSVSGNAQDYLVAKDVTGLQLHLDKSKCRDKAFWDLSFIPPNSAIPSLSLFQGNVKITVKLFDAEGQLVKDKTFDVATAIGENTYFEEPLKFTALERGESYTVKVYSSWSGSTVKLSKQVTT